MALGAREAPHRLAELGERRLGVALDRHGGGVVLAELPWVDVEMDDRDPRRHRVHVVGQRERKEVAAHREEQVVAHQEGADRRPEPRHGPRVERMREGEATGRRDALGHHRSAEQLRQLHQLREGVAVGDRVAGDQERALGVREEPSRLGDRPAVADDPPGHARGRREVEVALGVQDVDREREEDGPRRMRERGLRRAVYDPREVLEAPRLRGPLHEGLGDRRQVGPEDRLGDREALVVLPRGQEERRAGLHRVVQHPHRVAQTRRDVDVRRGDPARRLGVAVRHRDGDRFLERQHVVDRGLAREPVHQRELGGPGVAEHHGDAFLLKELEERLLA